MNVKSFEFVKEKIEKFSSRAHLHAWHNNVLLNIKHRFSLKRSEIEFHSRYLSIQYSADMYVLTTNNDLFLITSRDVREVEENQFDPNKLYEQVVGEEAIFALKWDLIAELPTSLLKPTLEIFETYYGTLFEYPTLTIAVSSRILHDTYNGKVIFLPNSNLFPEEFTWALAMQRAHIDGREIPPRPEVCLGIKLSPLYEGLEWNGEGAE